MADDPVVGNPSDPKPELRTSDSHRMRILGRSAAVAVIVLTVVLALFTLSGGMFLPLGIGLAAVLLKWPTNRPALLLTGVIAGFSAISFGVQIPTAILSEEYRGLIVGAIAVTGTSVVAAWTAFAALRSHARESARAPR